MYKLLQKILEKILDWLEDKDLDILKEQPPEPKKSKSPAPDFYVKGSHGKKVVRVNDEKLAVECEKIDKFKEATKPPAGWKGSPYIDPVEEALKDVKVEHDDRIG